MMVSQRLFQPHMPNSPSPKPCIVCRQPGACWDMNNRTQKANPELFDALKGAPREIWYCDRHAREYLFPAIDAANGNTCDDIVRDLKRDGQWHG
jgi:hypothetical protein